MSFLSRHAESAEHMQAVEDNIMQKVFERSASKAIYKYSEKTEALAYAMRTAYYTAHENSHNTKYSSLLNLQRLNGLEILKSLRVGDEPIMNLVLLQKKLLTHLLILLILILMQSYKILNL